MLILEKLEAITEQEWSLCNEFNRNITEEFLRNSTQLSPQTVKSYRSNLMIWFNYVRQYINNKSEIDIKSRDYLFFQNWLISMGHSSADIRNKRAAISSLNNYIILFYSDVYEKFKNFIVRGMPMPEKTFVHEKQPPTKEEFNKLIAELEKREEWQKIAWLMFSFSTGCRRAESRQLLKEFINYAPITKTKTVANEQGEDGEKTNTYYQTHKIRCKGSGKVGKLRKLKVSVEAFNAIKKWLEVRGDDNCPYVFVARSGDGYKQISESTLNVWCSGLFSEIIGRRVHPHIWRESRATSIVVEEGKDIEAARQLLGHASVDTTKIYVIKDDDEDEADDLF